MNFLDDLDQLNQHKEDDGFKDLNAQIYDEHDYILGPYKNPEFFYALCNMCDLCKKENIFRGNQISYNENGFTKEDLDQIKVLFLFFNDDSKTNIIKKDFFDNVTSLNELHYFHNLEKIFSWCFYNCPKLKSIIFPEKNSLKIGMYSFSNCISLEKVFFPKNIIEIRPYSFSYCTSLKEITIPKKFKDNIKNIFYYVDLTKVNITYI